MAEPPAERRSKLARWIAGDEPSTLVALFGPEGYRERMDSLALRWALPIIAGVGLALLAAGDAISGPRRLAVAIVLLVSPLLLPLTRYGRADTTSLWLFWIGVVAAGGVLVALVAVGPDFAAAASAIAAVGTVAFVVLPSRAATSIVVGLVAGFGVIVSVLDGYPRPVSQVLVVGSFAATSSTLVRWIVAQIRTLADELADANARLRRYVAPQVAAGEDASARRCRIAVVFIDLRGFTRLSADAEPEDVVELLADYYATAGDEITRCGGTVGAFAGDGLIAWFGDHDEDEPCLIAVEAAMAIRAPMVALLGRWSQQGYELGCGVGIAYGYATLGSVGFEGRRDYTALGSVVNLASRLCGEAADGEVLLDRRAAAEIGDRRPLEQRPVLLKGFGNTVAYVIGAA